MQGPSQGSNQAFRCTGSLVSGASAIEKFSLLMCLFKLRFISVSCSVCPVESY